MSWNDELLTTLLEEHCQDERPRDLSDAIMRRAQSPTPNAEVEPRVEQSPQPKRTWLHAAIVVLAATVVLGVWASKPPVEAQDPQVWLPLRRGATWQYRVNGPDGNWRLTETLTGGGKLDKPNSFVGIRHRLDGKTGTDTRLIVADAKGIYISHAEEDLLPFTEGNNTPACMLKLPPRAGDEWKWVRDDHDSELPCTAKVLAVDEELRVPAGTFRTTHVRSIGRTTNEEWIQEHWFAPDVGIVRTRTTLDGTVVHDAQLEKFTPGKKPWNAKMALPALLAKSKGLYGRGMPDEIAWIETGSEGIAFEGAFARVRYGDDWQTWYLNRERVTEFKWHRGKHWDRVIADERLFEGSLALRGGHANLICGMMGRINAAERGIPVRGNISFVESGSVDNEITLSMTAVLPVRENGESYLTVRLQMKKGKVVGLSVQ